MLSYGNQLKLKEDIVNDAFTKIKRKLPDLQVLTIIGSPQEKNYRNKIEFSFGKYITKGQIRDEEQGTRYKENNTVTNAQISSPKSQVPTPNIVLSDWSVGFHKQGEFSKIIDIDNCALISDEANAIFQHIKGLCTASGLPVHDQMTHQGFFRHLVIREGTNTQQFLVNLAVSDNDLTGEKIQKRDALLETFKQDVFLKEKITSFVITYNNSLADVVKSEECRTITFRGE